MKEALLAQIDHLDAYPDPECETLVSRLSEHYAVSGDHIICANGAAELIYLLVHERKPKKALLLAPTFLEYEEALQNAGCEITYYFLKEDQGFVIDIEQLISLLTEDTDVVFFCNPNNPTGIPVKKEEVVYLAKSCQQKEILLVLDECFCDFLDYPRDFSMVDQIRVYPELFILRAFTKTYGMAGLRLGYGITGNSDLIKALLRARQPWSVSLPAQIAGVSALSETAYLLRAKEIIQNGRAFLKTQLADLGFMVYDSEVNYLLIYDNIDDRKHHLWTSCRDRGVLIRDCSNIRGLGVGFYRVCVRTKEENQILIDTLRHITNGTEGEKQV